MEGSDFVKLYMKEGCLSWEAAGEKKSKVTTHFCSNFFFLICTDSMLDTRAVSVVLHLGCTLESSREAFKKNAWATPSGILMKLLGRGIQESVIL